MYKIIINCLGAVALLVGTVACSSDEPEVAPDNNQPGMAQSGEMTTVTFSGTVPAGIRSRATETSQIQQLWCAIYDLQGNPVEKHVYGGDALAALLKDGKFQISFTLAKDTKYKAFFLGDDYMESYDLVGCNLDTKEVWLDDAPRALLGVDEYLGAYSCMMDIDTKINANYSVVMKSIFAEIWLVSNQTETPTFIDRCPGKGAGTTFGKPNAVDCDGYFHIPTTWNF